MKKHKKIPTIIALIIIILGGAVGVFLVTKTTILQPQASQETSPKDIRISNITDTSFTISWITDEESLGAVIWGETPNVDKNQTDGTDLKRLHYITIRDLEPETKYYYKINSAGVDFDNAGIPWETITLPVTTQVPNSSVVSGVVVDNSGVPSQNIIVYIDGNGLETLSAQTSENGNFVIPLTLYDLPDETLLQIFAQGGSLGVSSAQILLHASNPIPQMTLGQTHDFRGLEEVQQNEVPNSSIDLPEATLEPDSKITIADSSPYPTNEPPVILSSLDEGEILTDTTPQFSGSAPAGETLTITVKSDPITQQIQVPPNGQWSWNVPEGLEPGQHSITINWTDAQGILRQLTRTFEVSAAEGPSTTPTITPSPSPTTKATIKPTATAIASNSATPAPLPQSGSLTPTFILSIIGIGLISIGVILSIKK